MSRKSTVGKGMFALLLMVLALTAVSGCASSAASNLEPVALGANDNGTQVQLQKGQTLVVSLEGNPSTGYNWEAADLDQAILKQIGEPEFKAESDLVGAPGTLTLRFEAAGAGQTELKLVYHRSWEESVEPLEIFTVQVTVS